MANRALNEFLASGTQAEREAFTPTPPDPVSGPDPLYIWYETDTGDTYAGVASGSPREVSWFQMNTGTGALAFPQHAIVPLPMVSWNNTIGSAGSMSSTGQKVAAVFTAPKSGVLRGIEWLTDAVGNNPDNGLRVSFQNITSGGVPDGTADQYRDLTGTWTAQTWMTSGIMSSNGTDGGSKRSVTAGDRLAIVWEFISFTSGDDVDPLSCTAAFALYNAIQMDSLHYLSYHNGSNWVVSGANGSPSLILQYDDDSYASPFGEWCVPYLNFAANSDFTSSSNPREGGLRFKVGQAFRVIGFIVNMRQFTSPQVVITLYNSVDSVVDSVTIDAAASPEANAAFKSEFPNAHTLIADSVYRLTAQTSTASATVRLYHYDVNDNALLQAFGGGIEWYWTQRPSGGSWTDTTTRVPFMSLIFDAVVV